MTNSTPTEIHGDSYIVTGHYGDHGEIRNEAYSADGIVSALGIGNMSSAELANLADALRLSFGTVLHMREDSDEPIETSIIDTIEAMAPATLVERLWGAQGRKSVKHGYFGHAFDGCWIRLVRGTKEVAA